MPQNRLNPGAEALSTAHWISRSSQQTSTARQAPVFRREFRLAASPSSATLRIAGLGLHAIRINGVPVGSGALEPAISDPRRVVYYSRHDVTSLLRAGDNTVEVTLGRGFFDMATPDAWRWNQAPWRAEPRLICALTREITLSDGRSEGDPARGETILVSDGDWICGEGPVRFDSMYEGESYDDRCPPGDWGPVALVPGPGGELIERPHEPVVPQAPVKPRWRRSAAGWIGDVGQVMAGVARYDLPLADGQQLRIRFGEKLDDAGELICENGLIGTPRFQTDLITGAGRRLCWQPEFSYKGFQYLCVEGLDHRPEPGQIVAVPLVQQVRRVVGLDCDVPILNRLVEVMAATVLNNLHHIPTDTPTFEKNGWTGDVLVSMESMSGLFDLRRLFTKWLDDIAATQRPSGQLAVIAPSPGWGYEHGECAPAPEWTCVLPGLLTHLADVYGDLGPARRHWDCLRRYLEWELSRLRGEGRLPGEEDAVADGLAHSELGDYLSPGYIEGPPPEDSRLSASCFLYRGLRQAADLAERLDDDAGRPDPRDVGQSDPLDAGQSDPLDAAERFRSAAEALRERINGVFLDRERGCYRTACDPDGEYRQTSNLMPLAFGIVPEGQRSRVLAGLVADVRDRGHHLNTGHIGTSLLLNVLTDGGFGGDALQVATQRSCPSWGFWLDRGATTMWERWDAGARSHDHFFEGTVADWILTRVAGVRRMSPDWAVVRIQPGLVDGVSRCRSTRSTSRGRLTVDWDLATGRLHLEVPQGMVCQLELGGSHRGGTPAGPEPLVEAGAGESDWELKTVGGAR